MPIKTGEYLRNNTVYIDYSFEEVMFRRDHITQKTYAKFYGEKESENPTPHNNRLYSDALLSGSEISKDEYIKGKPRKITGPFG